MKKEQKTIYNKKNIVNYIIKIFSKLNYKKIKKNILLGKNYINQISYKKKHHRENVVTIYQKIEEVPKNNQFKLFDFLYKFKNHIIKK